MISAMVAELVAAWRACADTECFYATASRQGLAAVVKKTGDVTDDDLEALAGAVLLQAHDCPKVVGLEAGLADVTRVLNEHDE